jgi:hypothetical protein
MAFSRDGNPFSPWEPFQPVRDWPMNDPEQAYTTYLESLNGGQAFSTWDNEYAVVAWGESFVLDSLLNMYEATERDSYLQEFVSHADAMIAQGDDCAGRPDYRGLALPGWSTSGAFTLARTVFSDKAGQPALEIVGRSLLHQNQVAVRLSLTTTTTGTLWVLDVHRSMAGRVGIVVSDTVPLTSTPDWDVENWPDVLYPGDALVYDTYYPWFMISTIRLYGLEDDCFQASDFEIYHAMHADYGEYAPVAPFILQSLVDQGQLALEFQELSHWGRYWKVRYVGEQPLAFDPQPGALMRLYEVGLRPITERFVAPDLDVLAAAVEQESALVRIQVLDDQTPQPLPSWRFLSPQRYRMALHTGLITYPLLRFALMVEQADLDHWQPDAQRYLQYARDAVDSHNDEWRTVSSAGGYYAARESAPVWFNGVNLPYNHQATIGRSLLLLYDLTHDETYRTRAMQIAQVLRDGMSYNPRTDSYSWCYWFGEGYDGWRDVEGRFVTTYDGFKGPETIFYASIDSDFARLAYDHSLVFTKQDIIRLSNTFLNNLTNEDGELGCYVDGRGLPSVVGIREVDLFASEFLGAGFSTLSAGCAYGDKMTTTEYLGLAKIVPAVYQRVQVVQPFPPTPKNSGRAPYGLARLIYYATWRLPPQSGDHMLCARVRDAQGAISGPWCVDVALNSWRYYMPLMSFHDLVH